VFRAWSTATLPSITRLWFLTSLLLRRAVATFASSLCAATRIRRRAKSRAKAVQCGASWTRPTATFSRRLAGRPPRSMLAATSSLPIRFRAVIGPARRTFDNMNDRWLEQAMVMLSEAYRALAHDFARQYEHNARVWGSTMRDRHARAIRNIYTAPEPRA